MRYVNYVNDEITEMHAADEEDSKAHKKAQKKFESQCEDFFHNFFSSLFTQWLDGWNENKSSENWLDEPLQFEIDFQFEISK